MTIRLNQFQDNAGNVASRLPTITLSPVPEESSSDPEKPDQNQATIDKSQFTFTPQTSKTFMEKTKKP